MGVQYIAVYLDLRNPYLQVSKYWEDFFAFRRMYQILRRCGVECFL